ncbi:hypothetical protein BDW62DRAFT_181473 [Aspergillus aurantiobrunneus]
MRRRLRGFSESCGGLSETVARWLRFRCVTWLAGLDALRTGNRARAVDVCAIIILSPAWTDWSCFWLCVALW